MTGVLVAPLTDVSVWVRSGGPEIVLLVLGALLLARFASSPVAGPPGYVGRAQNGGGAGMRASGDLRRPNRGPSACHCR